MKGQMGSLYLGGHFCKLDHTFNAGGGTKVVTGFAHGDGQTKITGAI